MDLQSVSRHPFRCSRFNRVSILIDEGETETKAEGTAVKTRIEYKSELTYRYPNLEASPSPWSQELSLNNIVDAGIAPVSWMLPSRLIVSP